MELDGTPPVQAIFSSGSRRRAALREQASGVEFHLSPGEQIRLLRRSGFEIEDLIEVYAPEGARTRFPFVDAAWASRWPCEEIWKARKWL